MACCLIDVSSGRSLAGHRQTGCSDSHVVWLPVLPCFFLKVAPPPPTTIIALQSFAATALPSLFLDSSAAVQMCCGSRKSKCTSNVELNSLISITCLRGDGEGGGHIMHRPFGRMCRSVAIAFVHTKPLSFKMTCTTENLHRHVHRVLMSGFLTPTLRRSNRLQLSLHCLLMLISNTGGSEDTGFGEG